MTYSDNPELQAASDFALLTDRNIFLTGRAGTGKTTFLHALRKQSAKRMVVVAPTGVAAINAGGVTIHSFFQLPFGPILPGRISSNDDSGFQFKFSAQKIALIKSIDLLVIDEISMVRADLLDGIDAVLRMFKNRYLPFGGVQLLMIGDLFQLSPIVRDDEWDLIRPHYPTAYFFGSKALKEAPPVVIELKKIYRQNDDIFINLLNAVRNNKTTESDITLLNSRYIPNFNPPDDEGYIQLTTHNHTANNTNMAKLREIKHESYTFKADIKGEFPESMYPHEANLELKLGAQIMFNKNDSSFAKRYYNGKIGKISRINSAEIVVKCKGEEEIIVGPEVWKNIKYTLNPKTQEIEEQEIGTFSQYPLKLAWAITIHKSQGLTFEKAIIDAASSFTHGQVYVALSRCKTLEGMVLKTPIATNSIKTDSVIDKFTTEADASKPGHEELRRARHEFQQKQISDLFHMQHIARKWETVNKTLFEHKGAFLEKNISQIHEQENWFHVKIAEVAQKFQRQLAELLSQNSLPEENTALQERISKAIAYFHPLFQQLWQFWHEELLVDSDNKTALKQIQSQISKLKRDIYIKMKAMEGSKEAFDAALYVKNRWNADLEFESIILKAVHTKIPSTPKAPQSELFIKLRKWRVETADNLNVSENQIISLKMLQLLADAKPVTISQMKKIKGIGAKTVNAWGKEIVLIIQAYIEENKSDNESKAEVETINIFTPEKEKSWVKTLRLYQQGKTMDEIKKERNLSISTLEGHLLEAVKEGELQAHTLVAPEKLKLIETFADTHNLADLKMAKEHFGETLSWFELRIGKHILLQQ